MMKTIYELLHFIFRIGVIGYVVNGVMNHTNHNFYVVVLIASFIYFIIEQHLISYKHD